MAAGVFGYLGYDMVRQMEELGPPNPDPLGLPDAILVRPTIVVVFDAVKDEITVVTPVRPEHGVAAEAAHARAVERLPAVVESARRAARQIRREADAGPLDGARRSPTRRRPNITAMVRKAKDYIAAGDIFQVVLSQRFEAPFTLPPFALYRALRRINPSPFLYFLDFGGFALAGSSPEILVRSRDGEVTIRPIAGTRPRGATPDEDAGAGGRAARRSQGARRAPDAARPRPQRRRPRRRDRHRRRSPTVLHRVLQPRHAHRLQRRRASSRKSTTRSTRWPPAFPAGTVSGAPKVRAMQIIDELEKEKRGLYAGCVGYFAADGDMDTCIVLRTALVKDGMMYVQAGAGIVADSDPDSEQDECVNKAQALFRAAEEARRFASAAKRGQ